MTDFTVNKTSHSYLLGVAQYELSECHSQRDKLRRALERIEQRANESGTGEMGLLDTIHDMHRYAREALQDEVRPNRNTT